MEGHSEKATVDATFLDKVESWVRGIPRKRRGVVLIATSALLVALGTIGVLYNGNLVWINRLEHPFIFGCIAAAAFGVGVVEFIPWAWLRFLIGLASGLVVLGWAMVASIVFVWGGISWPVASADAPGDGGYQAVVYEQLDVIDTLWTVSIQQTRGLLSREWHAGCISNDATADSSIEYVQWQSPRHLAVYTANSSIFISVDPRTGKPQSPIPITAREAC
jgi:hypothetical protein